MALRSTSKMFGRFFLMLFLFMGGKIGMVFVSLNISLALFTKYFESSPRVLKYFFANLISNGSIESP